MGTTAQKGAYLLNTKSLLKDKINALGGSIDDETTFREYTNQLDAIYDHLPKTSFEEGESITLENTLKGKLNFPKRDGKEILGEGQAKQDSTQGYNLLPPPYETTELNGIKLTNNGDGTYTLNGTSTGQALFWGTNFRSKNIYGEKFVGCPSDWNTAWGYCQIQYDDNTFSGEEKGSGVTLDNSKKIYRTALMIRSGITFTNTIIKPMVTNDTSKTYADFEKYSGGYSSPSPSWEQEVKCVAGRNIADLSQTPIIRNNITQYSVSGDDILIKSEADTNAGIMFQYEVQKGENITISYEEMQQTTESNNNVLSYLFSDTPLSSWEQGTLINRTNKSATATTTGKYLAITLRTGNNSGYTLKKLQVTYGNEVLPFLPFNTIQETIKGRNALSSANAETKTNNDFSVTCNGNGEYVVNSIPSGTYRDVVFQLKSNYTIKNGDYLQVNNDFSDWRANIILRDTNNNNITNTYTYNTLNRIFDLSSYAGQTIKYISIGFSNTAENKGTLKPLICNSSTQVPFEPYKTPKNYQFTLGDWKFFGIGNYKDLIVTDRTTKKWYKLGRIGLFDDSANLGENGISEGVVNMLTPALNITGGLNSAELDGMSMCNMLTTRIINNTGLNGTTNSKKIRVTVSTDYATTYSGVRQLLANIKLFFVVETPTLDEITGTLAEQCEAFWNAQSLDDTTIIEGDGDLPMIVNISALKGAA